MSINKATQSDRNALLERGNRYVGELSNLFGLPVDLEKMLATHEIYTFLSPRCTVNFKGQLGKTIVKFEPYKHKYSTLGMTIGQFWTNLGGDIYFLGKKPNDPENVPTYWKGEEGQLKERRTTAYGNPNLSTIHLLLFKPEEYKIVLADVGETPFKF